MFNRDLITRFLFPGRPRWSRDRTLDEPDAGRDRCGLPCLVHRDSSGAAGKRGLRPTGRRRPAHASRGGPPGALARPSAIAQRRCGTMRTRAATAEQSDEVLLAGLGAGDPDLAVTLVRRFQRMVSALRRPLPATRLPPRTSPSVPSSRRGGARRCMTHNAARSGRAHHDHTQPGDRRRPRPSGGADGPGRPADRPGRDDRQPGAGNGRPRKRGTAAQGPRRTARPAGTGGGNVRGLRPDRAAGRRYRGDSLGTAKTRSGTDPETASASPEESSGP